ncbi:MAG: hypothetical protein HFJ79_09955 [Clostridiales bacterium]|nr:hypothetical protein [Clostridiales bacterium]
MKKLAALLAGTACCCLLASTLMLAAAPAQSNEGGSATNPYFQVDRADAFGNKSIAVLGDSISHGANAPRIYEDSYIAQIKQSLWDEVGYENYGFASIENTMWNNKGNYHEVHNASWGSEWKEQRIDDNLGRFNLSATKQGTTLNFTVEKDYRYMTVYYEVSQGGSFDVIVGGKTTSVDTSAGLTDTIGRSAYIELNNARSFQIKVTSSGKTVAINGVGYYNNTDGVVVNNYASNGSKLIDVSDNVIDFACDAGVLIMAHGYNDSHFQDTSAANRQKFTQKIDYIIDRVMETGCKVIVNDMCWTRNTDNFFRTELKRLADETAGLYVSAENAYGGEIINRLSDGVHPGIDGHHMIGELILAAMNGEPMPTAPTKPTQTTMASENGYVMMYKAPLKDASAWMVGDGDGYSAYPDASKPALIVTSGEDGLTFVRTNDSKQPWTDARTYVDTTVDLTGNKLYYKITADCAWNLTISFAENKDTIEETDTVKLASYIMKEKGTSIGYDDDIPAGVYEGSLDLTEVMTDAAQQGRLNTLYTESFGSQYIGRMNLWHVAGTADVSKVVVNNLFLGHEGEDMPTDSTAASATGSDTTVTSTTEKDQTTTTSTHKDNPKTGENTVLLVVDAFLLTVSAGMLLITRKMRKSER